MEASNSRNTLMLDTDLYTAVEDLEKLKSEMRAVAKFDQNFTTNIHRQGWSVQPDRLASTLFKTYSKFARLLGVYKVSSITVSDLPSYPITNCKSLSLWNIFFFFTLHSYFTWPSGFFSNSISNLREPTHRSSDRGCKDSLVELSAQSRIKCNFPRKRSTDPPIGAIMVPSGTLPYRTPTGHLTSYCFPNGNFISYRTFAGPGLLIVFPLELQYLLFPQWEPYIMYPHWALYFILFPQWELSPHWTLPYLLFPHWEHPYLCSFNGNSSPFGNFISCP